MKPHDDSKSFSDSTSRTTAGPDEICTHPSRPVVPTRPSTMPIYPAAVYECESTEQADALLSGASDGFVYQRDGHPNATALAEQCRQLHQGTEIGNGFAVVTSTGMSALSLAMVSRLRTGDHVLLSDQLYGRTTRLVREELSRWGVTCDEVDTGNLEAVEAAFREETRMVVVETIANPLLHVADLDALSELSHARDAVLLVDNTFATPFLARPFDQGADLVMESISKIMNGHGDLMMGLLCGRHSDEQRVRDALSSWGMTASPFDCWLASRGLATAHLRVHRACENAMHLAALLESLPAVNRVYYPGLPSHPSHELAQRVLRDGLFGSMLSVELKGGREAVDSFFRHSREIRFCPSLGEIATTVSHPRSTSHRGMSSASADQMGIVEGVLRISCGVESAEFLGNEFQAVLAALD